MNKEPSIPKVAQDLIAGTVGGWAQVIVGQPLDTIKVRLQTQPSPPIYKNATDCFRQLVKQEGVSSSSSLFYVKYNKLILYSLKVYIVVLCLL